MTEASPDTSTAPGLAELGAVFGPQLEPQEEGSFGLDRWTAVDGPPGVDVPGLRVSYPAGSVSPSASREHGSPEGGMQVFLPFAGEPMEAAHLRYWVRFPEDFAFVKGGKLPGLYGGTEVSGGEEPDGTDGFSTRLMWRADGAGEVYLYAPGESGTSLGRGDWTWRPGDWLCVEQRVVLNDPEAEDGSVTVWVDGEETYTEDGMQYRTVGELRIDGVFFSTFYGGADPSWAPPTDQHADFAGFAVSGERLGCG
ncbi:polysaccharide lyase [Blastococcus sp. SYSU D00820]